MIEIEIDLNNDIVYLIDDDQIILKLEIKKPYPSIAFFKELFNRLNYTNVKLTKLDENTKTIIREW